MRYIIILSLLFIFSCKKEQCNELLEVNGIRAELISNKNNIFEFNFNNENLFIGLASKVNGKKIIVQPRDFEDINEIQFVVFDKNYNFYFSDYKGEVELINGIIYISNVHVNNKDSTIIINGCSKLF